MTMTATHPDLAALLRAVAADPACDTVRLVLADWLDENAEPERVPCPACRGRCRIPPNGPLYRTDPLGWNAGVPCVLCEGVGTVPDRGRADRAELLRVQCELVKHGPPRKRLEAESVTIRRGRIYFNIFGTSRVRPEVGERADVLNTTAKRGERAAFPGVLITDAARGFFEGQIDSESVEDAAGPLRSREAALLAAHPEWRPACPECERRAEAPPLSHTTYHDCKTGRVGRIERGLLVEVAVPRLADLMELGPPKRVVCPDCILWKGRVPRDCRCGGTRRVEVRDWRPTAWATRELLADPWRLAGLTAVRCGDRVPHDTPFRVGRANGNWLEDTGHIIAPHIIPVPLFTMMWDAAPTKNRLPYNGGRWLTHDTPDAARDALAAALAAWVRGQAGEKRAP